MFHKIDMTTWKRREIFYYFSEMAPTGYSVTAKVDVTEMVRAVKAAGMKFFPAYLWVVTKNLCKQQEFTCAYQDGVLGYYDTLTPLYAVFHNNTETFSLMWTPYCDSFPLFHRNYLKNQEKYGNNPGILSQPATPPPANAYTVSALPWVHFDHFSVHSYENKKYFFPSVEAGKWQEEQGKKIMPLSLTLHHAATDGIHVSKFLEDLQRDMDNFVRFTKETK